MSAKSLAALEASARRAPDSIVEAAARVLATDEGRPARTAFLARALNALAGLATGLDEPVLADAAGAPSDYAVILRALEDPGALTTLRAIDPLAPARLRGLRARAELLAAEGGALSARAVADLLGITRQAVAKRRRAGRLLGLTTGRYAYVYPAWQFGDDGTQPGLESVLNALSDHDPWMQLAFFLAPNRRLAEATPLSELRKGHVADVLRAARAYGEQGAA
jgi:hypothetical protein